MTQKNRTLEGKNRTLGGEGGQKSSKIVGHHLCTFPYPKIRMKKEKVARHLSISLLFDLWLLSCTFLK